MSEGVPTHGKRPPLGHIYYEAFNRDNVTLVNISDNPITEITRTGLRTGVDEYEVDVIITRHGIRRCDRQLRRPRHPGPGRRHAAGQVGGRAEGARRRLHDCDVFIAEHFVERSRELGVPITDEKRNGLIRSANSMMLL